MTITNTDTGNIVIPVTEPGAKVKLHDHMYASMSASTSSHPRTTHNCRIDVKDGEVYVHFENVFVVLSLADWGRVTAAVADISDLPAMPAPDPATRVDLPAPTVYVLDIELNGPQWEMPDGARDYVGHRSVHTTLDGAINTLDAWLYERGIDPDIAHHGEQRTETFLGNDVNPDLIDGDILTWGINTTEVRA